MERISGEHSTPRSQVERIINSFISEIQRELASGNKVYISKLGTLGLRHRGPRTARNPKTGVLVEAAAATFPIFSFSKNIKEAVRDTRPLHQDTEEADNQPQKHQPQQQQQAKDSRLFGWLS